jgi:hypothetical protein
MQSVHNDKFGQLLPTPVLEEQNFGLASIVVHDHTSGPGEFVRRGERHHWNWSPDGKLQSLFQCVPKGIRDADELVLRHLCVDRKQN